MPYDVAAIRERVKRQLGPQRDPTEFKPPKAEDKTEITRRFFILPPFRKNDPIAGGPAPQSMDDMFFLTNGAHYLNNQRLGCPRVLDGRDCPICSYAFDLIRKVKDDTSIGDDPKREKVRAIGSNLLPATYRIVNVYFPGGQLGACNPEEIRDKVFWYNAPSTVFNIWWDCLSRDNAGDDPFKPNAFGVFFDEMNSYLFSLVSAKQGLQNSYNKSGFLVSEQLRTMPLAISNGGPDTANIARILASRHNLFSKLPEVKFEALERVAAELQGSGSGGFDIDENSSPVSSGFKPSAANQAQTTNQYHPQQTVQYNPQQNVSTQGISGEFPVTETVQVAPQQTQPTPAPAPTTTVSVTTTDDEIDRLLRDIS